jgi:spermidine/putrescine transport system permease protein
MNVKIFKHIFGSYFFSAMICLCFLFIYIPIAVLVLFSFNEVAFPYRWVGFSAHWYQELYHSEEIWHVVKNSCIVAISSVILSLTMGLFLVFYSTQSRLKHFLSVFYANLFFPEIMLAVGLLLLFTYCSIPAGLLTLIAGHTVLGLGYVVPILSSRFAEIDPALLEASLDLGATLNQTFYKVVIPLLIPALIASGLLVFVISFDDFLIAFFCAGTEAQTLPLYIYATIRTGISPLLNAVSTLLLLISSFLVLLFCWLQSKIRIF